VASIFLALTTKQALGFHAAMRLGIASSFAMHVGVIGWLLIPASLAVPQVTGKTTEPGISVTIETETVPQGTGEIAPLPEIPAATSAFVERVVAEPTLPDPPRTAEREPMTPTAEPETGITSSVDSVPPAPPLDRTPITEVRLPRLPRTTVASESTQKTIFAKPAKKPKQHKRSHHSPKPLTDKAPVVSAPADLPPSPPLSASDATATVKPNSGGEMRQSSKAPIAGADLSSAYLGRLRAYLERYKSYPRRARRQRIEGFATLRFTMDAQGNVLHHTILSSTGSIVLDKAIDRMIKIASPLPGLPPELARSRMTFEIPINFTLK